jgi:hypothetical protein
MKRFEVLTKLAGVIRSQPREKIAGLHFLAQGARAMGAAGKAGAKVMQEAGYPTAAKLVQYAPHAATLGAGALAYKSETGQKIKHKIQRYLAERKYRKMMEQQGMRY